ncbi:MAG: hypothetical protein JXR49_17090 [Acidobacteria bacterium]|nr:hypothetical protein [Acidobacteriota bacterium]
MNRRISGSWILVIICALSLAGYLLFSAGLRYWLSSLDYFQALYQGLSLRPDPLWRQIGSQMTRGVPWDPSHMGMLAGLLLLSLFITLLAWRCLKGRLNLTVAFALFMPTCLIVPQSLLAMLFWPDGRGQVTYGHHMILLSLTALGLFLYVLIRKPGGKKTEKHAGRGRAGWWGLVFLVPVSLIAITALLLGIGNHPGYDAGAYHLPLAAGYAISNSIPLEMNAPFTYPSNAELILRWFLLPGNDRLAALPDWIAMILIPLLLYRLCLSLNISRQAAIAASCAAITFPVLTHLSIIPNPDLIGIVPTLVALILLLELHRTRCADPVYFGLFGLAFGLAAGTRLSLLPACLFLAGGLLLVMLRNDRSQSEKGRFGINWRWIFRSLLITGSCAFAGSGFWYLRNALVHQNPFFPVSMFGLPGMPLDAISPVIGIMSEKPWMIALYPWTETGYTYIYDTGIGAVFAAIVLPGLVWWPIAHFSKRNNDEEKFRFERMLVYLCILFCLAYFVSRPSVYTRHGAFAILLSFFVAAEMWQRLKPKTFRVLFLIAFLVMCVPLEKSLSGSLLYRLAIPQREGAARFELPAAIDALPPSRIFNAAEGHLTYGCMGRDYRHKVITRFRAIQPQELRSFQADYVLIREDQKAEYTGALNLELVASGAAANPADALLLYRIQSP